MENIKSNPLKPSPLKPNSKFKSKINFTFKNKILDDFIAPCISHPIQTNFEKKWSKEALLF